MVSKFLIRGMDGWMDGWMEGWMVTVRRRSVLFGALQLGLSIAADASMRAL